MGTSSPELLIPLDRSQPRGLRAQIEDELRGAIRAGRLAPGTPLPSTRALAVDLGVTRGVVVDAYDQLIAEGYLAVAAGRGTVGQRARRRTRGARAGARPRRRRRRGRLPARACPTSTSSPGRRGAGRPAPRCRRCPSADLGYGDPRGLPVLRSALADYLARVRGVRADPERIVVCDGFGHGLQPRRRRPARRPAATSSPSRTPATTAPRRSSARMGIRFRGVDVDDEGIVVDGLRRTAARAVVVTPAHQSPTGVVLSADRRQQLVDWAARRRRLS